MNLDNPLAEEAGRRPEISPEPQGAAVPEASGQQEHVGLPHWQYLTGAVSPDTPILPREVSVPGRRGSAPAPQGVPQALRLCTPPSSPPRGRSGDDPPEGRAASPGLPCSSLKGPGHLWTTLSPRGDRQHANKNRASCRKAGELESAQHALLATQFLEVGWGFHKWGRN